MTYKLSTAAAAWSAAVLLCAGVACTKKVSVLPPAPPKVEVVEASKPNPPTIVSFAAEPGTVERGQSAALRWVVKDATQVEIDQGIGVVALADERRVSPQDDTIYRLHAVGPGGTAQASTTLAVMLPPPPPPKAEPPKPTISQRISTEVEDVFFDFDRSDLRSDARTALAHNAAALKEILSDFPTHTVILEGHCDERGSAEYNLGLGDRRSARTKTFLGELGVPLDRLLVISYGKERPQCTESDEACWQKNRRVHFTAGEDQRKANVPAAE